MAGGSDHFNPLKASDIPRPIVHHHRELSFHVFHQKWDECATSLHHENVDWLIHRRLVSGWVESYVLSIALIHLVRANTLSRGAA